MEKVYKACGKNYDEVCLCLQDIMKSTGVKIDISEKYLDTKISTLYNEKVDIVKLEEQIYIALGGSIYSNTDMSLASCLVRELNSKNIGFAVAESLTGGLVASDIVSISGASKNFIEGIVSYSNIAKINRLNVNEFTINTLGAVSSEVAKQMASGLLSEHVRLGVSTTGIAGPTGATPTKPLGLTYIGIATDGEQISYEHVFHGDRDCVRNSAKNMALYYAYMKAKQMM